MTRGFRKGSLMMAALSAIGMVTTMRALVKLTLIGARKIRLSEALLTVSEQQENLQPEYEDVTLLVDKKDVSTPDLMVVYSASLGLAGVLSALAWHKLGAPWWVKVLSLVFMPIVVLFSLIGIDILDDILPSLPKDFWYSKLRPKTT